MRWPIPALLLALAAPVLAEPPTPAPAPPTVSRETTYYLGPLDAEGYVNYAAALDAAFGDQDATPENNAFVGILENTDTHDWDEAHLAALWDRLGAKPAADGRPLFVEFFTFVGVEKWDDNPSADEYWDANEQPWLAKDKPQVAKWLTTIDPALDAIAEALQRPQYFAPLIFDPEAPILPSVLLPHLGTHRAIGRSFVVRINRSLALGDINAAVLDLLTLERLSRLTTHEPLIISNFVGLSINALAHSAFTQIINHPDLKIRHANRIKRGNRNLPKHVALHRTILETHRCASLELLIAIHREQIDFAELTLLLGEFSEDHSELPEDLQRFYDGLDSVIRDPRFDLETALQEINLFWDGMGAAPDRPEALIEWQNLIYDRFDVLANAVAATSPSLAAISKKGLPASGDTKPIAVAVGRYILDFFSDASGITTEQQSLTLDSLEDVAIALARYRLRKGHYPETLDELAPKYLKRVPVDFFNGKPLHYRLENNGYLLYSIGTNAKDDGGVDDYSEGDMIIRVGPTQTP